MLCKLMMGSIYAFKAGPQILGDLTGGHCLTQRGQWWWAVLFLILLTGNLQISDSAMTVILASIVWLMVLLKLIILNTVRYCYHLSDVQCGHPSNQPGPACLSALSFCVIYLLLIIVTPLTHMTSSHISSRARGAGQVVSTRPGSSHRPPVTAPRSSQSTDDWESDNNKTI